MIPKTLISDVSDLVEKTGTLGTGCATGVESLFAFAQTQTTECAASFYEPIMCLVLQGAKEAHVNGRVVRYSAGDTLIVSHAIPVEAAVMQASPDAPYTALALRLDLAMARSMQDELADFESSESAHALNAAASDAALIDAIHRLFNLSKDPVEARSLAPLVLREIHFRLLRARHGGMLRQLLNQESPASRIAQAIATMRANYKTNLPVADLASDCGMSLSAFHEHFRSVTATTPLQYQKELRLLEARRLLVSENVSVATAAYDVGYESPTQFSREYSRKFGIPPSMQRPRNVPLTATAS